MFFSSSYLRKWERKGIGKISVWSRVRVLKKVTSGGFESGGVSLKDWISQIIQNWPKVV